MALSQQPRYPVSLTIDGKKMPFTIQFDVNDNPTKMGLKMQFILTDEPQDPRDKQELANKISVALQKRLGDAGITVAYDDRNAYNITYKIAYGIFLQCVTVLDFKHHIDGVELVPTVTAARGKDQKAEKNKVNI